jgi:hypothetical protein
MTCGGRGGVFARLSLDGQGGALGFRILFRIPLRLGVPLSLALVVRAVPGRRDDQLERLIVVFPAFIADARIIEPDRPSSPAVVAGASCLRNSTSVLRHLNAG